MPGYLYGSVPTGGSGACSLSSAAELAASLADVDAVEDVPVVVDPLLDALPVTVLPECEEALGVLERVLLQRIVVDHRPARRHGPGCVRLRGRAPRFAQAGDPGSAGGRAR